MPGRHHRNARRTPTRERTPPHVTQVTLTASKDRAASVHGGNFDTETAHRIAAVHADNGDARYTAGHSVTTKNAHMHPDCGLSDRESAVRQQVQATYMLDIGPPLQYCPISWSGVAIGAA
jgi:hypothetical protein